MFFLAVGVYADETHPCLKHANGCDGEFKDVAVNYTIVSGDWGFLLRGSVMTGENGFFDLYLPKKEGYIATFTVYCKEGAGFIPKRPGVFELRHRYPGSVKVSVRSPEWIDGSQ